MPILKIGWNTGDMAVDLNQILLMEMPKVKGLFKLMRTSDCRIDKFYGADVDKELLRYLNEQAHTELSASENFRQKALSCISFYGAPKPGLTLQQIDTAIKFLCKHYKVKSVNSFERQHLIEAKKTLKSARTYKNMATKHDRIIKVYKDVMHID